MNDHLGPKLRTIKLSHWVSELVIYLRFLRLRPSNRYSLSRPPVRVPLVPSTFLFAHTCVRVSVTFRWSRMNNPQSILWILSLNVYHLKDIIENRLFLSFDTYEKPVLR